jgi:hypothetical protein
MTAEPVRLPAPAHISPAWLAQPVHSPERRRFSVLCHRGWCDHDFKVQAVAALTNFLANTPGRPPSELPRRECPIPGECECECHDEDRLR